MKTKAENREINRKAKMQGRAQLRARGLVPVEIWIVKEYKETLKDYAKTLNNHAGNNNETRG